MSMVVSEVRPAGRVDAVVSTRDGAPAVLTTYAGVATCAFERSGAMMVMGGASYPVAFFLPDCHPYGAAPIAVTGTVALAQFSMLPGDYVHEGPYGVAQVDVSTRPDPRGNDLHWVQVAFELSAPPVPMTLAYQVTVLAAADSITA